MNDNGKGRRKMDPMCPYLVRNAENLKMEWGRGRKARVKNVTRPENGYTLGTC